MRTEDFDQSYLSAQRNRLLVSVVLAFLLAMLSACQTAPSKPATFGELLTATGAEITAAANTLADARDAGIVSSESEGYQRAKRVLTEASDYIQLAWAYWLEGDTLDAKQARQFAVAGYNTVRPMLVEYQRKLEERQ